MDNNQTYTYNPYAQNVVILKSYFKRPAVLIVGIIFCISIVLGIASALTIPTDYIGNTYAQLYNDMGLYEEAQMFQDFYSSPISGLSSVTSMLPSLAMTALMAFAYIIIYKKSKNDDINSNPKVGFVILFIISIVQLVISVSSIALVLLIFAILGVGLFAVLSTDTNILTNPQDKLIVDITLGVCVLIFVLMFTLLLVYAISRMKYTKSLKNSVSSVQLSYKGTKAYGVSSIIFGIVEFVCVVPTLAFVLIAYYIGENAPVGLPIPLFCISFALVILSGVLYIVDGVIALGYRKHVRNVMNGYEEGPYNYSGPAPYSYDVYEPQVQENTFTPQPEVEQNDVQPPVAPTYRDSQPTLNEMPVYSPPKEENTNALYCCPQCGSAYGENDIFCNICGTKLR